MSLLIGARRRDDAHLEPAYPVDAIVVHLGKADLLAQAQRVVAAPVEGLGGDPLEVTDAGQRDRDQAIQELPHPLAAQRHHRANRVARADLERGDRLFGPGDHGLLARDHRQVTRRGVQGLGVGDGLAEPDVEDDLMERGYLHRIGVEELARERLDYLGTILLFQTCSHAASCTGVCTTPLLGDAIRLRWGDARRPHWAYAIRPYLSMTSLQRLQTRTLVPSSWKRWPTRVGLAQCGHSG